MVCDLERHWKTDASTNFTSMKKSLIAVIGDVHHHISLAVEGLERIESELNRPIDQVFSVGDLGLFLNESDWDFLTGPKKYRTPEDSPAIREAWSRWRWAFSVIAGNHEPFNRYRDWDASAFFSKLEYTNAGELAHSVPPLKVAGLSGIYHPQALEFLTNEESRSKGFPNVSSWPEIKQLVESKRISRSRLSYYKEFEIEILKSLNFTPHLLLLHDWPVAPAHISNLYLRRPEAEIVATLKPDFVCCGHHHVAADFRINSTRVLALNIISTPEWAPRHIINPDWCALFEWDETNLNFLQTWPKYLKKKRRINNTNL